MKFVRKFGYFILLTLFIGLTNSSRFAFEPLNHIKYVIFDTDMALDDALALRMLLKAEKYFGNVKILAITCARGNATMDDTIKNTYSILNELNRTDIPIYRGEMDAISPNAPAVGSFRGPEGTSGDIDVFNRNLYPKNVDDVIQPKSALQIIHDIIVAYPKRISWFGLGPLTNIAKAIETYPEIRYKVREMFIMGGTINGFGNKADCIDFNVYWDPAALIIALNEFECPITILPWEGCISQQIENRKRNVGSCEDITLLSTAKDICFSEHFELTPCDALLVTSILFPQLSVNTKIVLRGNGQYGKCKKTIITRLNEIAFTLAINWAS